MAGRAVCALALIALSHSAAAGQSPDTVTYATAATRDLVLLARQRHLRQDSLVRDYRADVDTRIDAAAGRSRFARLYPLIAHETAARVTWRRPNDLKLEILGVRQRSVFPDAETDIAFDRPWFVPRALGDSIRLMGMPETAALHPLAPGAERYYHYAITDSLLVSLPGQRDIRAIGIRVQPKVVGPSIVAGDMWVDAETADVVRLMVTFLGEYLWDTPAADATARDSAEARNGNRWAQRILTVEADLEYSLWESRYWMPYRQYLALTVEVPILVRGALPVRFLTTFRNYEINTEPELAFRVPPDTAGRDRSVARCVEPGEGEEREGGLVCPPDLSRRELRELFGYDRGGEWDDGQWEIAILPQDSLAQYAWRDSLALDLSDADAARVRETVANLARIAEDLPDQFVARRRYGLAWDRLADIARFNRVRGLSVGVGYRILPGPAFTSLQGDVRFGLSDLRPTASLALRRESPSGALEIRAFRSVLEAEPWTRGQSLGNSLNALFAAHDDADYYLGLGGSVSYYPFGGRLHDTEFTLGFERHRSMQTESGSAINDAFGGSGVLAPNPSVSDGDFVRARIEPRWRAGSAVIRAGIEGLAGDVLTGGRAWATARIPFTIAGRGGALSLKAGYAAGDSVPQLQFRAGGPETVRGYDYGARTGNGVWAAQLDVAVSRRSLFSPVVFVDVGNTFDVDRRFQLDEALLSAGVGVSLLKGWLRLNLAKGLNPEADIRFDLLFGAPR